MSDKTHVAIVYFSAEGHTEAIAGSIAKGAAQVADTEVKLVRVDDVDEQWEVLHRADALVFGTPTHIGGIAWQFQAFIEKTSGAIWLDRMWTDKLAAGFTCSAGRSGDKLACLERLVLFAAQMGMIWVPLHLLGGNYSTRGGEGDRH